jgi:hypothetical protein
MKQKKSTSELKPGKIEKPNPISPREKAKK